MQLKSTPTRNDCLSLQIERSLGLTLNIEINQVHEVLLDRASSVFFIEH